MALQIEIRILPDADHVTIAYVTAIHRICNEPACGRILIDKKSIISLVRALLRLNRPCAKSVSPRMTNQPERTRTAKKIT